MNWHHFAASLAVALLLAGCSTPIRSQDAALAIGMLGTGEAQITITRDGGVFGSACGFHIAVDGTEIGVLKPGQKLVYRAMPGTHEIAAFNSQFCGGALQYYSAATAEHANTSIGVGSGAGQAIVMRRLPD